MIRAALEESLVICRSHLSGSSDTSDGTDGSDSDDGGPYLPDLDTALMVGGARGVAGLSWWG